MTHVFPYINTVNTEIEWDDEAWDKRDAAIDRCQVSHKYHQKRERFFDVLDGGTKAFAVLGGAASISHLMGTSGATWIAAGITLISTLSLVVGYAKKARLHADLAKSFRALEVKIISEGIFDEHRADELVCEVLSLELNEPRPLNILVLICQNEIAVAKNAHPTRVSFLQKLFSQIWDFDITPAKPEVIV